MTVAPLKNAVDGLMVPTPEFKSTGGTAALAASVVFATKRSTGLPVEGMSGTSAKSAKLVVPSVVMKFTSNEIVVGDARVKEGDVKMVSTVGEPSPAPV